MKTIHREELKQKLDRKESFRLVMALGEWAYQAEHIPGSMHFATTREALQSLKKEDEIVVYCSDENCIASRALGQLLCSSPSVPSRTMAWSPVSSYTPRSHKRCTSRSQRRPKRPSVQR